MEVREQILTAATRLMAARGFSGTSLQAVADAVGIRKASLLYHYGSKEELRRSVLEQLLEHWNEVLPRLLMASVRTGVERFDAVVGELVRFFSADPDRARLLLREVLDRPAAMRAYLEEYVRPWVGVVADHIGRSQRASEIYADADAEAYVLLIITTTLASAATVDGAAVLLPGEEEGRRRYLNELVRVARTSLFCRPSAAEDDS